MLLNFMSFTAFAEEIIYQDYWIDLSEIPELQSKQWIFDSTKDSDNPGFSKYIYAVDTINKASYDEFISGEDSTFSFRSYYLDLTNIEFDSNDYSVISLNKVPIQSIEFEFRDGKVYTYVAVTKSYFIRYFPDSGTIQMNDSSTFSGYSLADESYINKTKYYIHIESNHPDFPVPDFAGGSDVLNVDVVFNPGLSGTVDRSMTADDGSHYMLSNITMAVYNHNKFPIQYTMDIRPVDSYTDFVFRYYENDWVYAPKIDSAGDFWNQIPQKQQKATLCHYVLSGRTDVVNFNFNQINLVEGVEYVVEVYAARNDYGYASELAVSSVEEVYPELYQIQNTLVYQSQFSMLQYSDVKYDPTNSSNGVLPYDFDLGQKYEHSYNAVEKDDGEIDYTGKDVYSDKDSWYHKPIDDNTQTSGSSSSSSSSSNEFSNFAKSFQNFFGFIRYMFNFFPSNIKTIFGVGFSAIVIIALVKVLFKS